MSNSSMLLLASAVVFIYGYYLYVNTPIVSTQGVLTGGVIHEKECTKNAIVINDDIVITDNRICYYPEMQYRFQLEDSDITGSTYMNSNVYQSYELADTYIRRQRDSSVTVYYNNDNPQLNSLNKGDLLTGPIIFMIISAFIGIMSLFLRVMFTPDFHHDF